MMAYLKNGGSISSEFTTAVPGVASASVSAWGRWRTEGLVHTNCGPHIRYPPPLTRNTDPTPSGDDYTETNLDDYNQCVFLRYYTMRKRAWVFPTVIKAAVGSHDLGPGDRGNGESPEVEVQSDPGSVPDTPYNPCDEDGDYDMSSVSSINSGSPIVVHNIPVVCPQPCLLPLFTLTVRLTLYRTKGMISM